MANYSCSAENIAGRRVSDSAVLIVYGQYFRGSRAGECFFKFIFLLGTRWNKNTHEKPG